MPGASCRPGGHHCSCRAGAPHPVTQSHCVLGYWYCAAPPLRGRPGHTGPGAAARPRRCVAHRPEPRIDPPRPRQTPHISCWCHPRNAAPQVIFRELDSRAPCGQPPRAPLVPGASARQQLPRAARKRGAHPCMVAAGVVRSHPVLVTAALFAARCNPATAGTPDTPAAQQRTRLPLRSDPLEWGGTTALECSRHLNAACTRGGRLLRCAV